MTDVRAYHALLDALQQAQKERKNREYTTESGELGWEEYERQVMWATVNRLREKRGKEPIDIDAVIKVENLAYGHFDYSKTFAIGCESLVYDRVNV